MIREENGRKRVRELQRKLQDIKKEKEQDLQDRKGMIAHIKDQLQEAKARTNMEGKYIKKSAEVSIAQTQKRCTISEKQAQDEIEVCYLKKNRYPYMVQNQYMHTKNHN